VTRAQAPRSQAAPLRGIITHVEPARAAVTYRTRLTLALLAIAMLPLALLAFGVRREMTERLEADATQRVETVTAEATERLDELVAAEGRRIEGAAALLARDARLRVAIADASSRERRWLTEWASTMMPTGFAMLQLQDSTGLVLSSGHARNDFGRVAAAVPRALLARPLPVAVVRTRTPDGPVRALAWATTINVRGAGLTLIGGAGLDSARVAALSPDPTVAALLVTGDTPRPAGAVVLRDLPYLDDTANGRADSAWVVLAADTGPTAALKAGVTRWLLATLGLTIIVALVVATLLARIVSAPLVELSERTERLDLDRLDQRFATGRADELGTLERTLDALANRLRTSVSRLREAERAAATGDLARQVNHDIKNGLAPIRNVLRHLGQTADQDPAALAAIFAERRETLESSVAYLDELARNYARLSPSLAHRPTDPRQVIVEVASAVTAPKVELDLPAVLPLVRADAVVLHRILDNLVTNAVESLEGKPGRVVVGASVTGEGVERRVRITVADSGRGMTRPELELAFNDFHTTKPAGTGLGLSVVRRLLTDLGGSVRAETKPGAGSTFTVEIPAP
jgi:signal transduction histidine kinase